MHACMHASLLRKLRKLILHAYVSLEDPRRASALDAIPWDTPWAKQGVRGSTALATESNGRVSKARQSVHLLR